MPESIHTVRWINQITDQGWDIYLHSSYDGRVPHTDLKNITYLSSPLYFDKINYFSHILKYINYLFTRFNRKFRPQYFQKRLARYINKIEPDIIHTLETQGAGYLFSDVIPLLKKKYLWWHTNWGSDIYIYGKLKDHQLKIYNVLSRCDFYSCECERDVKLAYDHGLNGKVLPVYPNTGGFNLNTINYIRDSSVITSKRKIILLKGYQGWAGRALVGIRAIERCADLLKEYKLVIFSNTSSSEIQIASKLMSYRTGIEVILIPENTEHEDILKLQSQSRVYLGLSIGDAISTSLLEAMAMGSFPIQSCTACASEWIEHEKSGFIVPPEDPEHVEKYLRKALLNDELVDRASELNIKTISARADISINSSKTINTYREILKNSIHEF